MNKFKYYFFLLITTVSLFSCSKDEVATLSPPREYAGQYATDLKNIEDYLKTYYITIVDHAGFRDDQDVTFTKIEEGGTQPSIYSYLNSATFPKLLSRDVKLHGITYKLYYLVLREGIGESPSNVDEVFATYRGDYLENKTVDGKTTLNTTKFEEWKFEPQKSNLYGVIRGWKEIFPQFKTGNDSSNPDGTISYNDFGAGVMFIPSGLAYYAEGKGIIPAYAPLIFSFKLFSMQRLEHEFNIANGQPIPDGIMSYLEDLDGDGYIWTSAELPSGAINPDDSDKDGIPDFLDTDDDGDGISTRTEITAANGTIIPFAEIPSCDGNITNPARIKRHLVKCN